MSAPLNTNCGYTFAEAFFNMILIDNQSDSSVSSLSNVIFSSFTSCTTCLLNALHFSIGWLMIM